MILLLIWEDIVAPSYWYGNWLKFDLLGLDKVSDGDFVVIEM